MSCAEPRVLSAAREPERLRREGRRLHRFVMQIFARKRKRECRRDLSRVRQWCRRCCPLDRYPRVCFRPDPGFRLLLPNEVDVQRISILEIFYFHGLKDLSKNALWTVSPSGKSDAEISSFHFRNLRPSTDATGTLGQSPSLADRSYAESILFWWSPDPAGRTLLENTAWTSRPSFKWVDFSVKSFCITFHDHAANGASATINEDYSTGAGQNVFTRLGHLENGHRVSVLL